MNGGIPTENQCPRALRRLGRSLLSAPEKQAAGNRPLPTRNCSRCWTPFASTPPGWVAQTPARPPRPEFRGLGRRRHLHRLRQNESRRSASTAITVVDFQRDYDLAVQTSAAARPAADAGAGAAAGVPGRSSAASSVRRRSTTPHASMGLGISNEVLGKKIASDPQFFGATGTFDRGYLTQIIRAGADRRRLHRRAAPRIHARRSSRQAFAGGIVAPEAYLRAVHEYRTEERDISYIVLDRAGRDRDRRPERHRSQRLLRGPQGRVERAGTARRQLFHACRPPTGAGGRGHRRGREEALRRRRRRASPRAEKRQVQQIVFKDRAEADQAAAALAGGKTFDASITERNLKPADVDLGLVTKDKIADPAIAEAAFALAAECRRAPLSTAQFGPVILRVTTIEPGVVTSVRAGQGRPQDGDRRRARCRRDRATCTTRSRMPAPAGDTLAEVASKYGLKVVTIAVDRRQRQRRRRQADRRPSDRARRRPPSRAMSALRTTRSSPTGTFVWYEVTAVTAPRERPLAEVRDKVVAAWKDAERAKRLAASADAVEEASRQQGRHRHGRRRASTSRSRRRRS